MKYKLFCCGITSNQEKNIKDLVESTRDYVDGFCWTVHTDSKDKTYDILNENKKEGAIIQVPYIRFHDISANFWLHCGIIKNGDWVMINDSKEKFSEFWLKKIKHDIEEYNKQDIGAVYCSSRPFLFKFFDFQSFNLTPHWTLTWPVGKVIIIPEMDKDKYIVNKRKLDPVEHFCIHDVKYMWEFGVSNQVPAFYGKYGNEIVQRHEQMRLGFRYKCEQELGLEFTLKSLEKYLKSIVNYPQWFVDYFETEFSFSEFYQLKVLNYNFMGERPNDLIGMHPRYKWSFRNHLKFNNGWIDPDYEGTILKYDKGIFN